MAGERAAIFGQFIELLSESEIDSETKQEVYRIMLEILEEFDVKGIASYMEIDSSFDSAYNEKYPPDLEDYDE